MEIFILTENDEELECENFSLYNYQKKILKFINSRETKRQEIIENFKKIEFFKTFSCYSTCDYSNNILKNLYNTFKTELIKNCYQKPVNIKLPVGAGKSYTTLAIINETPTFNDNFINIIIVPSKLISQWNDYIKNFKMKSEIFVISTSKTAYEFNRTNLKFNKNGILVLISNTMLEKVVKNNLNVYRVFVDEVSVLCKFQREECSCKFCTLFQDFNPIFTYYTCATFSNTSCVTVDLALIEKVLRLPEINLNSIIINLNIFKNIIDFNCSDEIIEKLQIDNFDTTSDLFKYIFEEKIKQIQILQTKFNLCTHIHKRDDIIKEIEKTNNEIKNIKERILNKNCLICLDEKVNKTILLCCKISICFDCVKNINLCVYCKKNIKKINSINMNDRLSLKIDKICKISVNSSSKIALIGSHTILNINAIKKIAIELFGNINSFKILEGTSLVASKILNKFRNDNAIHILYFKDTSKVVGYNLEFVTDLILMTSLEENLKTQIIGRFQRVGRTQPLNVYEYFYSN